MPHGIGGNDSKVGTAVRHDPRPLDVALEIERTREYRLHRQPVLAMLNTKFSWLAAEHDEIYHEAWLRTLEMEAAGKVIRDRRALLKTLADFRATDIARQRNAEVTDPNELVFLEEPDPGPEVDAIAQVTLDADALRLVIDKLDARQAAVLKLRFDRGLTGPEIQAALGISAKRFAKIMDRAFKAVLAQVEPDAAGDSPWLRHQRSLLLACEAGIATAAQRAEARQLVERDPRCRAMLRAMRTSVREVAVILPMPPVLVEEERRGTIQAILGQADRAFGVLRQGHDPLLARATSSSTIEQASSGLLGGLGAGAVAKSLALCIALGGTAAVCVDTLVPGHHHRVAPKAAKPRAHRARPAPVVVHVAPQPVAVTHALVPTAHHRAGTRRVERPVSSPAATPPPSPAPAGATEFGPGAIGSSTGTPAPAAAPTNGGGEFTP